MASLVEELISVLKAEDEIYEVLIPIADAKTKVIIKNDLKALQETTEKEQRVIERIQALERKREEVIVNIGTVINRNPKTLTMKMIIKLLGKQPEEQAKLSELHDSLTATIKTLVAINERNKSLIQQSLEMIEFNMNLIQSTRMSPGSSNYTKGAEELTVRDAQTGMFDVRQ